MPVSMPNTCEAVYASRYLKKGGRGRESVREWVITGPSLTSHVHPYPEPQEQPVSDSSKSMAKLALPGGAGEPNINQLIKGKQQAWFQNQNECWLQHHMQ